MSNELTVLDSKREAHYQNSLVVAKRYKILSFALIPCSLSIWYYAYLAISVGAKASGNVTVGSSAIPILAVALFLRSLMSDRKTHFPQFSVGDLVFYNPMVPGGAYEYKISKQHSILNSQIPVWEVVSLGETSLVIKRQDSGLMKEVDFSDQGYLTSVVGLLPSVEERKMLAKQ